MLYIYYTNGCVGDAHPQMYASAWFLTLFARKLPALGGLFALWDLLWLDRDPGLPVFLALALVLRHRDQLVAADPSLLVMDIAQAPLDGLGDLLVCIDTLF